MGTRIAQPPPSAAPPALPSAEDIHQMTRDAIKAAVAIAQRLGYLAGRLSALGAPPCPDQAPAA